MQIMHKNNQRIRIEKLGFARSVFVNVQECKGRSKKMPFGCLTRLAKEHGVSRQYIQQIYHQYRDNEDHYEMARELWIALSEYFVSVGGYRKGDKLLRRSVQALYMLGVVASSIANQLDMPYHIINFWIDHKHEVKGLIVEDLIKELKDYVEGLAQEKEHQS